MCCMCLCVCCVCLSLLVERAGKRKMLDDFPFLEECRLVSFEMRCMVFCNKINFLPPINF